MTLAEKLNKYEVDFGVTRGVVSLEARASDESLYDDHGNVTDAAFNAFLEELDKVEAFLDHHPFSRSGSGGWVCRAELGNETAWYDDNAPELEKWQEL